MKTAIEIFNAHLEAFTKGEIKINTISPQFTNSEEVKQYLLGGGVLPVLMNKAIENSQSITEQMFIYNILKFSSERTEKKCKTVFLNALKQLGIN